MGTRNKGGLIGGFDQLRAPDAPTISVTAGLGKVTVTFTNPSDVGGGAISSYTATAIASGVSTGATSATSPLEITGLSNGTTYSVTGLANNAFGVSPYSDASSAAPSSSNVGILAGGLSGAGAAIDFIYITSIANASDFGDLFLGVSNNPAAVANSSRYIFAGGFTASDNTNVIQYGAWSRGSMADFGDLTNARNGTGGVNNDTRAVFCAGSTAPQNVIDYVTIASTGNATDFGDLTQGREVVRGVNSTTRGVFIGAESYNVIDYVTIASTGNATDFGDLLSAATAQGGACSNSTRGLYAGGFRSGSTIDVIQYITIASTGNATDFGDLLAATRYLDGVSTSTRAVFMGAASANTMQYVTIGSTGNATDFGDLTANRVAIPAGTSNAHGGLS